MLLLCNAGAASEAEASKQLMHVASATSNELFKRRHMCCLEKRQHTRHVRMASKPLPERGCASSFAVADVHTAWMEVSCIVHHNALQAEALLSVHDVCMLCAVLCIKMPVCLYVHSGVHVSSMSMACARKCAK
jgi:hypothetical protein